MSQNVPKRPTNTTFSRVMVGEPISSQNALPWSQQLSFLHNFNKEQIVGTMFPPITGAYTQLTSSGTSFSYWKTPGNHVLEIMATAQVEPSTTVTQSSFWVNIPLPHVSASWIGVSPFDTSITGSARLQFYQPQNRARNQFIYGLMDVSNVPSSSILDIRVDITNSFNAFTSNAGHGLATLTVSEVPLNYVDPLTSPLTEIAIADTWGTPGNRIYQYGSTGSIGVLRMENLMARARSEFHPHWQLCFHSDPHRAPRCRTSSSNVDHHIDWMSRYQSPVPTNRMRVRKTDWALASNLVPYTVRIVYQFALGNDTTHFTLYTRPLGGGSFTAQDLNAITFDNNWRTFEQNITLDCSGTDNIIEFYLMMQSKTPVEVRIRNFALIENTT